MAKKNVTPAPAAVELSPAMLAQIVAALNAAPADGGTTPKTAPAAPAKASKAPKMDGVRLEFHKEGRTEKGKRFHVFRVTMDGYNDARPGYATLWPIN